MRATQFRIRASLLCASGKRAGTDRLVALVLVNAEPVGLFWSIGVVRLTPLKH